MRVARIGELGTTLAVTSNPHLVFLRSVRRLLVTAKVVPSSPTLYHPDGGDKFLRNVGFYKSHTA
jgi:hypothetical protein